MSDDDFIYYTIKIAQAVFGIIIVGGLVYLFLKTGFLDQILNTL